MDPGRGEHLWGLVIGRAERRGYSGWAGIVCDVVSEQLAVDGVAIAVHVPAPARELIATTGTWACHLEELQYTVGDGPVFEAYETGSPVLVPDMAAGGARWPGFAEAAGGAGVGAAFVFPLHGGAAQMATLDLYCRRQRSLTHDEHTVATVLADVATAALVADTGDRSAETAPWARPDEPGHYDDVNVATGLLAAALNVDIKDAFLRLRAFAFSHSQPVIDVARAVLRQELQSDAFRD